MAKGSKYRSLNLRQKVKQPTPEQRERARQLPRLTAQGSSNSPLLSNKAALEATEVTASA